MTLVRTGIPPYELSRDYFALRLSEAMQIGDQNDRFQAAQTDSTFEPDLVDFRVLAMDGIHAEQTRTIQELQERDNTPYDLLSQQFEAKARELEAARELARQHQEIDGEREERIRQAAQKAIEFSPIVEPIATKLSIAKIEEARTDESVRLAARIAGLDGELRELAAVYEVAAQPWPVPQVISEYQPTLLIEDEIPLPPETHLSPEDEVIRRLIEKHGRTHGASLMLTAYLIEHPDTIFTPGELGAFLYTDESHFQGLTEQQREECIRMRIHSLLNQNALVRGYLEGEDYVLQYGYRHFLDAATRRSVYRKRRIYRAVPKEEGKLIPDTFDEEVMVSIDGVPMLPDRPLPDRSPRSAINDETRRTLLETSSEQRESTLGGIDVAGLAQVLWDHEMLPPDFDGTIPPINLRTKLFPMGKNLHVDGWDLTYLKNFISCLPPNMHLSPTNIIAAALKIPSRVFKDKSQSVRLYAEIDGILTEFYEKQTQPSDTQVPRRRSGNPLELMYHDPQRQ